MADKGDDDFNEKLEAERKKFDMERRIRKTYEAISPTSAKGSCPLNSSQHEAQVPSFDFSEDQVQDLWATLNQGAAPDDQGREIAEMKKVYLEFEELLSEQEEKLQSIVEKLECPNICPEKRQQMTNELNVVLTAHEETRLNLMQIVEDLLLLGEAQERERQAIKAQSPGYDFSEQHVQDLWATLSQGAAPDDQGREMIDMKQVHQEFEELLAQQEEKLQSIVEKLECPNIRPEVQQQLINEFNTVIQAHEETRMNLMQIVESLQLGEGQARDQQAAYKNQDTHHPLAGTKPQAPSRRKKEQWKAPVSHRTPAQRGGSQNVEREPERRKLKKLTPLQKNPMVKIWKKKISTLIDGPFADVTYPTTPVTRRTQPPRAPVTRRTQPPRAPVTRRTQPQRGELTDKEMEKYFKPASRPPPRPRKPRDMEGDDDFFGTWQPLAPRPLPIVQPKYESYPEPAEVYEKHADVKTVQQYADIKPSIVPPVNFHALAARHIFDIPFINVPKEFSPIKRGFGKGTKYRTCPFLFPQKEKEEPVNQEQYFQKPYLSQEERDRYNKLLDSQPLHFDFTDYQTPEQVKALWDEINQKEEEHKRLLDEITKTRRAKFWLQDDIADQAEELREYEEKMQCPDIPPDERLKMTRYLEYKQKEHEKTKARLMQTEEALKQLEMSQKKEPPPQQGLRPDTTRLGDDLPPKGFVLQPAPKGRKRSNANVSQ